MIVDFEILNNIQIPSIEDFEVDNENISEEEFLKVAEEEIKRQPVDTSIEIYDQLVDFHHNDDGESQLILLPSVEDNMTSGVSNSLDVFSNPSTEQVKDLRKEAF